VVVIENCNGVVVGLNIIVTLQNIMRYNSNLTGYNSIIIN